MKPTVSVIIPTFNRRAMVRRAVASVLAQRDVEFELIVVDDGSTDGTQAELAELAAQVNTSAGRPLMRVISVPNQGPAAARNRGAALAAAPWLAFLDADDEWLPSKLARQLAYAKTCPQYAIMQTGELWFRNGRRVNPGVRHRKSAGDCFIPSLRTCVISPSAVMIRAKLFDAVGGFDEIMAAAEDYDLWLRVLVAHPVGLLDEPLVKRHAGHPDQLSATVPALDRFRILALLKLLELPLEAVRRAAVAAVLEEKCAVLAQGLARRGRTLDAGFVREIARAAETWHGGPAAALAATIMKMRTTMRVMLERDRAGATMAALPPPLADGAVPFAPAGGGS